MTETSRLPLIAAVIPLTHAAADRIEKATQVLNLTIGNASRSGSGNPGAGAKII
jgi:hypothetical protein